MKIIIGTLLCTFIAIVNAVGSGSKSSNSKLIDDKISKSAVFLRKQNGKLVATGIMVSTMTALTDPQICEKYKETIGHKCDGIHLMADKKYDIKLLEVLQSFSSSSSTPSSIGIVKLLEPINTNEVSTIGLPSSSKEPFSKTIYLLNYSCEKSHLKNLFHCPKINFDVIPMVRLFKPVYSSNYFWATSSNNDKKFEKTDVGSALVQDTCVVGILFQTHQEKAQKKSALFINVLDFKESIQREINEDMSHM